VVLLGGFMLVIFRRDLKHDHRRNRDLRYGKESEVREWTTSAQYCGRFSRKWVDPLRALPPEASRLRPKWMRSISHGPGQPGRLTIWFC